MPSSHVLHVSVAATNCYAFAMAVQLQDALPTGSLYCISLFSPLPMFNDA